jgi:hypothetical protein
MRVIGPALVLVGGLTTVVSLFLKYAGDVSAWDFNRRYAIMLAVLTLAAVAFAVASISARRRLPFVVPAVIGCFLFGEVFPIGLRSYKGLEFPFWLGSAGSFLMAVGGLLLLAKIRDAGVVHDYAPSPFGDLRSPAPRTATEPRPGWYADPAHEAAQRYWSGENWTAEVRP